MTKALVRIAVALERIAVALEAQSGLTGEVRYTYNDGAFRRSAPPLIPIKGDGGAGAPL
jgi:hypothetical protein